MSNFHINASLSMKSTLVFWFSSFKCKLKFRLETLVIMDPWLVFGINLSFKSWILMIFQNALCGQKPTSFKNNAM